MSADELAERLRVLLPETYEVFDENVKPRSMGSAGLKFGADGKVLWDQMWASFCHLAMAGGPPHRGRLLEPCQTTAEETQTPAYRAVAEEICRGIHLVTGLYAEPATSPGWLQLYCTSAAMCGWLSRAIVMENVSAVSKGLSLFLPTGSSFRVEKEIKNVITSVAKTCHYWQDHMGDAQHDAVSVLLASMDRTSPLAQIHMGMRRSAKEDCQSANPVVAALAQQTGLPVSANGYADWAGIDCRSIPAAIWMMRALCVQNVLSRREDTLVFVPVQDGDDADAILTRVVEAHRLAMECKVFALSLLT